MIAGISLQAANLYGYILCKMGGESDISKVTASFLSQTVFQTVSTEVPPRTATLQALRVQAACRKQPVLSPGNWPAAGAFYWSRIYTKSTILTILKCTVLGTKYMHDAVWPSPLSLSSHPNRTLYHETLTPPSPAATGTHHSTRQAPTAQGPPLGAVLRHLSCSRHSVLSYF